MSSLINHLYRFGDFTVDVDQRVLLCEGRPVPLTPKAFDTLLILLESSGRIVEKVELMKRLWPDTFVEEANITFNIQQLRKALNDDARNPRYVGTVARRGYRFIADVEVVRRNGDQTEPAIEPAGISSIAPPASSGRRNLLLMAAAVILLASAVAIGWKFSKRTNNATADPRLAVTSSNLKLEHLTVTGQSYHVAISPDGKYVAYERVFEQKGGIWMRQLAANTNVELIPPGGKIYGLAFSNQGEALYFVKGDPALALYRVALTGGAPTKIIDNLEGNFSLANGDDQIAFIRQTINSEGQREYTLTTAKADGTDERKLLTGTHPLGLDTPVWKPDRKSIICAYGNTIGGSQDVRMIEVSVADGSKKDLGTNKFFRITKMAWLPDGTALILSARQNLNDNNQLWRLTYPSGELTQITEGVISYADLSLTANADKAVASQETLNSEIWVGPSRDPKSLKKITQASGNFCWTPDGRLVYSSTASGNRDLWIMKPDGTEQKQLTVDPLLDVSPRVTPDNRYIVFISNRTGSFQAWRMDLDGGNQTQLTNGGPKNYLAISTDSKWVFYNTTDDWHVWKVSIDGGEPSEVTNYVASWPSVSPDQKTIASLARNGSQREFQLLPFAGGAPFKKFELRGGNIAGYRIKWTPDAKAFVYMAERDGPIYILKQALDGGPPEQIAIFDQDELFDFDYSADGQLLAVTRGAWQHDIVLIGGLTGKK